MARIILLKGINVGGHNRLPMADLRVELAQAGVQGVQTYIQSGNLILPATAPEDAPTVVQRVLQSRFDIDCDQVVLTPDDLDHALAAAAFPQTDPKHVHIMWPTAHCGAVDLAPFRDALTETEDILWDERVVILHTPNGIGRSKGAARLTKNWPVPLTARNQKTVQSLKEICNRL